MGLVNTVVPLDQIEDETVQWCKEIMKHSPTALRFLKVAMNADTDGLVDYNKWQEMLHYFTTLLMKLKRVVTRLKKNVIQTSINSLNSHKSVTVI